MVSKICILILNFTFVIISISCNDEFETSKPTQSEEVRVTDIGQKATAHLLSTLQMKLKTTISNQGIMSAINVCNVSAFNLTDSIRDTMDDVMEIKRTSLRYRNPKNAPDSLEREVLQYFQSLYLETGSMPEEFIEKIKENSTFSFRFYKPLFVKPLCLNCHGQATSLAQEISYELKRLYPNDWAYGYNIGDFRGLVRVSIK